MNAMGRAAAILAAAGWMLSACGGRPANPVATVQAADDKMNCQLMQTEYASNESRANALVGEKVKAQEQNAAKFVLMGMSGLLMMDLKDTEQVEIRALKDRNNRLARLMAGKGCPDAPRVSQPAGATEATSEGGAGSAVAPNCKDVGGYETYVKKTGRVCML
jgi:hypothetical protein